MEETREWKAVNILRPEPETKPQRRQRGCGSGCGCSVVLLILILLAAAVVFGYLGFFRQDLVPEDKDSEKTAPVLLLGVDRETREGPGRSDTIILPFWTLKIKSQFIVCTKRYLCRCACSGKRIRSMPLMPWVVPRQPWTVGFLLNRDIKYYLATDFQGFVKIVDTLGCYYCTSG